MTRTAMSAAFALAATLTSLATATPAVAAVASGQGAAQALRAGRYQEARRIAQARLQRVPGDSGAIIAAAQAEIALGLYPDARRRLERAAAATPDDLPVRDTLMRLLELIGDHAALAPLITASYDDWNGGKVSRANPAGLIAIATAVRLDGNWKDTNDVLRDAVKADRRATAANLDWGAVLLEKHNGADAEACFRDVLKVDADNPDAHAGLARVAIVDRYDGATAREEIARALAVNPAHAEALALRAQLATDAEDWRAAEEDVAAIRRTNPRDRRAARVAAAAALLRDDRDAFARAREQALAVHPNDGAFFAFVAEALTRHRRYDDARELAEAGTAANPDDAACLAVLAATLLRLGDEDAGLDALRRAWKRDPYDVRTYNLLNLYEKVIPRYIMVSSAHLRFRVLPAAKTAITEVVAPYLEERYRDYVARYGFEPRGPITFELYGDARAFAVRTVGLPGIGVAGVCFGRIITSQSPTNHAFNWGMVLAHELAHVFAIELSRSRVPRWFTEGLSEVETMRARPEWTRHDDIALYGAELRGDLPGLTSISNAFINVRSGDDAARAYALSAVAVDFLDRRFGFRALREALAAFGRGEREPAVLEKLAGMPLAELERAFREELAKRFAGYRTQYLPAQLLKPLPAGAAPSSAAREQARAGVAALARADLDGANQALARARALVNQPAKPASVDDQADTLFLSGEIALAKRDAAAAVAAFEGILTLTPPHDGYDLRVRLALAEIHRQRAAEAEAHLRRAIAFDPTRVEPRALLAELLGKQQRTADRLTELETALRLEPQTDAVAKEVVLGSARAGRTARVVELGPIAIFIDPADSDLHGALGRALIATGKPAAGAAALERALAFHPHDPSAIHLALAAVYDNLGDRQRAAVHRTAVGGK
jgi:predicted Zn-dependent protease